MWAIANALFYGAWQVLRVESGHDRVFDGDSLARCLHRERTARRPAVSDRVSSPGSEVVFHARHSVERLLSATARHTV